jgi:predicted DNA-binding antitoxin AbrB/MazE fold protein
MNHTIPAIIENGVIRPLEEIEMTNGENVEVILVKKGDATPYRAREILSEIASLPLEGENGEFSGEDHDIILYPKS